MGDVGTGTTFLSVPHFEVSPSRNDLRLPPDAGNPTANRDALPAPLGLASNHRRKTGLFMWENNGNLSFCG